MRCLWEDDVVFDLNMRLIEIAKATGSAQQAGSLVFTERAQSNPCLIKPFNLGVQSIGLYMVVFEPPEFGEATCGNESRKERFFLIGGVA